MGDIVNPGDRHGRVLPANRIELLWDGNKLCALVGRNLQEGVSGWGVSGWGVSGWGDSVHEALRDLADNLVREGVWIEVKDRNEWRTGESPDE